MEKPLEAAEARKRVRNRCSGRSKSFDERGEGLLLTPMGASRYGDTYEYGMLRRMFVV